jgi:hypothetical protein
MDKISNALHAYEKNRLEQKQLEIQRQLYLKKKLENLFKLIFDIYSESFSKIVILDGYDTKAVYDIYSLLDDDLKLHINELSLYNDYNSLSHKYPIDGHEDKFINISVHSTSAYMTICDSW